MVGEYISICINFKALCYTSVCKIKQSCKLKPGLSISTIVVTRSENIYFHYVLVLHSHKNKYYQNTLEVFKASWKKGF